MPNMAPGRATSAYLQELDRMTLATVPTFVPGLPGAVVATKT
jgi:hypothetical protein